MSSVVKRIAGSISEELRWLGQEKVYLPVKFQSSCDVDKIGPLRTEIEMFCGSERLSNVGGLTIKEFSAPEVGQYSVFDEVGEKIASYIRTYFDVKKLRVDKVWHVNSFGGSEMRSGLPFVPHWDHRRYFKGMLYLSDIDEHCGAIEFLDEEVSMVKEMIPGNFRRLFASNKLPRELMTFRPMLGSKGDLVIFDTNWPHMAGQQKAGVMREVLRFDFLPW